MTIYKLRPNGTAVASAATKVGSTAAEDVILSDASDATYLTATSSKSGTYNLQDGSGNIGAGKYLAQVRAALRFSKNWANLSMKYSGTTRGEITFPSLAHPASALALSTSYGPWERTGPAGFAWTSAAIDGLQLILDIGAWGNTPAAAQVMDLWVEMDVRDIPAVPTVVTPAVGGTVATDIPTLGATLAAPASGQKVKAKWQIAQDSGFTVSVKTVTESDSDLRTSGATTQAVPNSSRLTAGVWYIRAATVDEFGQTSAWSAAQQFFVVHPSSATNLSPTNGTVQGYTSSGGSVALGWVFSDPAAGDHQTAYQVVIQRNSDGTTIFDSGKVTSGANSLSVAIPSAYKDTVLRWKIQVWDEGDSTAGYSNYQLFQMSDPLVVSGVAIDSTGSARPTVRWNMDGTDGTNYQTQVRIVFTSHADGSVYDTGWMDKDPDSAIADHWTADRNVFANATTYDIAVYVVDNLALASAPATTTITTNWTAPETPVTGSDDTDYNTLGRVHISWYLTSGSTDATFQSWRIYRTVIGPTVYDLGTPTVIVEITDDSVMDYDDYTAPAASVVQYAVVQVADRGGSNVESLTNAHSVSTETDAYWLVDPDDASLVIKLISVTDDSYSTEYESATYSIIGRGRHVDYGDRIGVTGTLTAKIRGADPRLVRRQLEEAKFKRKSWHLRNPFGDAYLVDLGQVQIGRIAGVGPNEYFDVTLPYQEVA